MDRCSTSVESSQINQIREKDSRERVSRKKIKGREKGEKSRNTIYVFPMEGPNVGSLKWRVGAHLGV